MKEYKEVELTESDIVIGLEAYSILGCKYVVNDLLDGLVSYRHHH